MQLAEMPINVVQLQAKEANNCTQKNDPILIACFEPKETTFCLSIGRYSRHVCIRNANFLCCSIASKTTCFCNFRHGPEKRSRLSRQIYIRRRFTCAQMNSIFVFYYFLFLF